MKKSAVAIAVVVLVAAGLVLPAGYFGQVTEQMLTDRLENMPYGYGMEIEEYQRGWFSSTARIAWKPLAGIAEELPPGLMNSLPGGLDAGGSPFSELAEQAILTADVEIAHGPVFFAVGPGLGLFRSKGRVRAGSLLADSGLEPSDFGDADLELSAHSFSGRTVELRAELPRLEWTTGFLEMRLDDLGMESSWTATDSAQSLSLNAGDFDLSVGEPVSLGMKIRDLGFRGEFPEGFPSDGILAPVTSSTSIGEFEFSLPQAGLEMRMKNAIAVESLARDDQGNYGGTSTTSMDSMEFFGREFSPVEIRQEYGGFNEAALMDYLSAVMTASFEPAVGQPSPDQPTEPAETLSAQPSPLGAPSLPPAAARAIRSLLAASPYLDINVSLVYMDGNVLTYDLHLGYVGERAPASDDLMSMTGFLAGLDLSVEFAIPAAIAEELLGQAVFGMARMQGLLQEAGDQYRVSMTMQDGVLELNGNPLPLGMLLGEPPGAPPATPPG